MSFLDEYIHGNWRHSAHNSLARLLEHECRQGNGSKGDDAEQIDVVLAQEQATIQRAFGDMVLPCLPGDEIERQRAQEMREQQNPSADAYVRWGQGEMADKTVPLVLLECKYRVQTENVKRNTRKVGALYGELCRKFNSSRRFLEEEGRTCRSDEVVVFNATAVDDIRDSLELLCIGDGRAVFKVVDTEKLASSPVFGNQS